MGADDPARRTDRPGPFVRPAGYVDPEPIVRRIGDRPLFLGNRHAADPDRHDRTFEHVLSLTAEAQPLTTHHRPLVDGPGNDWASFERAVETARRLYRRAEATLVHCNAGISRSTTILATTIAAEEDRSYRDAIAIVQAARPHAVAHPALCELSVTYLAART